MRFLKIFRGEIALQQRKTTAPHSTGKDGYKQMETFAIEQVMILMRFEREFDINFTFYTVFTSLNEGKSRDFFGLAWP